ncbi:MAG: thioredoxin domain-containing protein [Clostridia bacterium]|jgi:uncharacterized protein YyaL (SSP411 family)|nr:thioredoxin domain-containing protein [Clostridia bacterium]
MLMTKPTGRLSKEKSPYLLQHANNPVDWFPWGEEAFNKAKAEDKPIFLSIGYSTCHWCHVMEHESFENTEVAGVLNQYFICIKVDREERPDIDAVYMNICQSITGNGGWPLTIFMTSDQKPFYAATYLPKDSRGGMIGLLQLLPEIAHQWKTNRKDLESVGNKIKEILIKQHNASNSALPTKDLIFHAVNDFKKYFDSTYGGFGIAPKFPAPHNLIFLMNYSIFEKDEACIKIADKTLSQMYKGGIFDHIGGGFSRYSTDRKWLIPHFEKMLYDNALLAIAYLQIYRITHKPIWEHVVRKTLDYVLNEMTHENGGFYCAQDADSDGEEGKYYSFTPEEIISYIGENDGEYFCKWFGITQNGNFEGKSIPNLIENQNWENTDERIVNSCRKLYSYRLKRASLRKDDKILTSWNSLMIVAFAKAGYLLNEPKYLQAAEKANTFITENLMNGERLSARWREGEAAYDGKLDDYAFYALALLELYEATFNSTYLQKAIDITDIMLDLFFDSENGGFYLYSSDSEELIDRPKEIYDGAMPSGNSVAAYVLCRLAKLTGEIKWQNASDKQLKFLSGSIEDYPMGYSFALLSIMQMVYPSGELLCVSSDDVPSSLTDFLSVQTLNISVLVKTPKNTEIVENIAPFTREYPIPENGTAFYFCQNGTCKKPVYNIKDLYEKICMT